MSAADRQPRNPEPAREPAREQIAKIEIGNTTISRKMAWVLIGIFIPTLASVPVMQHIHDIRKYRLGQRAEALPQAYDILRSIPRAVEVAWETPASFPPRVREANNLLLADINQFETQLEDESLIGQIVLPPMQHLMAAWLGVGNEEAYIGRDGWLFFRPDLEYLTGPAFLDPQQLARRSRAGNEWTAPPRPDPREAIVQFHDQLAERGITLVIVPTPVKPMVHPEKFSRAYDSRTTVLDNPSFEQFKREMEDHGVLVFDPGQALVDVKHSTAQPQYLRTDTHWTPDAMELAATLLSEFIDEHVSLPADVSQGYYSEAVRLAQQGDIAVMLKLPEGQTLYPDQEVEIRQIFTAGDELWRPDRSADVLLLGDSFSNIYSLEAMGWGESAGFAEQLSYSMQRPLDVLLRNDAAAYATREMLSRELARGRDLLDGKRVVIWQFAMRELAWGDWKLLDLTVGEPPPTRFVTPGRDETMRVTGTVEAVSPAPRPGSVPYSDHIVSVHLIDLHDEDGPIEGGEAIVYLWSMRSNVWTDAARLRPGQRIDLRLSNWYDVADRYDGVNRSELDDDMLLFEDPGWGEMIK